MSRFIITLLASCVACITTTIGIFTVSRYEKWSMHRSAYFMSYAAGVLLVVSFLHLIPESFEMTDKAPYALVIGFFGLYFSNRLLRQHLCHHHPDLEDCAVGVIPVMGIGLHSFIDGIIYAVTFSAGVFTGVLAAIGMILHEFPEGVVTFVLLQKGGFRRKGAIKLAFFSAALSTPLGTVVAFPFVHGITEKHLGTLLAATSGALIYVAASHLLPAAESEDKEHTVLAMVLGMATAFAIISFGH